MIYAEVAVEAARTLDHETYTYSIPDGQDTVPGHRVWVPFGRRTTVGYVVSVGAEEPGIAVKEIERSDPDALLHGWQVELARRVAEHYWVPLIEVLRAMVPPRIRRGKSSGAGPSARQSRHSQLLLMAARAGGPEAGPEPTAAQRSALAMIAANPVTLLHGVTGSGKTEVYTEAARQALEQGLRALVLVPEIALTPQLVGGIARRLGERPAVLHSQLTELERAQEWWRVRRGEARLVIGSRSAVFAPIPRLGLICVDEEGSSAYKQDRTPRYDAVWVARRMAELTGARLVLGTATPTVATYAEADAGRIALARLPLRVRGVPAPVELVDMREEAERGHRLPLSRRLIEVVERALEAREQSILFLNRRGAATFLLCRDCGKSIQCPGCSVSLVQHPELGGLHCHYCGFTQAEPEFCPHCGSRHLSARGMGTQRLEGLVKRLWPAARVARLDSDAIRGADSYFRIWESFQSGAADILVGTQMVARGFDLENVTTVGVVDADLPLHFPDFRSAESTYALVTQVAGRAGRAPGQRHSRVIVQTSNPEHYALRHAAEGDYEAFYRDELPYRQAFGFPPFGSLAVLTYTHKDDEKAATMAREAAEQLASGLVREGIDEVKMLGPAPAFIHKLRGEYRWQVTLKGQRLERARMLQPRGKGWSIDVDPVA
ncbi:MAG: primosomal protein N' [Chloroflexi bacterium]|nr:MAG: primosomal protein N' [Chloroflexota bacterium]